MSKRPPISTRPLAFIDVETTGLDPNEHEIIEIAIVVDYQNGETVEYSTKVKPQRIETAQPKALEINGYKDSAELWDTAPAFKDIANHVSRMLAGCVIVGHNPSFDMAFIQAAIDETPTRYRLPYHKIDTVTLAFEHLVPYGLESLSLDRIREFLGWSLENNHSALQDTLDARRLYYSLTNTKDVD